MFVVRILVTKLRNRFQPNLAVGLVLQYYHFINVGLKEYESKTFDPFLLTLLRFDLCSSICRT